STRSMALRTASTPTGSCRQPSGPAHVSSVQALPSSHSASPPGQSGTVLVVVVVTTSPADGEASAGSRARAGRRRVQERMAGGGLRGQQPTCHRERLFRRVPRARVARGCGTRARAGRGGAGLAGGAGEARVGVPTAVV